MGPKALALLLFAVAAVAVAFGLLALAPADAALERDAPRSRLPVRAAPTDHAAFFTAPFPDAPSVTRRCLECHEDAAREVMGTTHWTWAGASVSAPGTGAVMALGKRNEINNFCGSIAANWPRCTSCHAGYGWKDDSFHATAGPDRVDCLVCHDGSGTYRKDVASAGFPAKDVDLLAVARSVTRSGRENCGACHFAGGGGDAVKHGDLDSTLGVPPERIDVHMGRVGLVCADCHRTEGHHVKGRLLPPAEDPDTRVSCTDCHAALPHHEERLDSHAKRVACQTCHVPFYAVEVPTKMWWDWSLAGRDGDPHEVAHALVTEIRAGGPAAGLLPAPIRALLSRVGTDPDVAAHYDKKKGLFLVARRQVPEYRWYDGTAYRSTPGERLDGPPPFKVNEPRGAAGDPRARIWPFKVHRGVQPFDLEHRHLLVAHTFGPGGYWTEFDWERALQNGASASGVPYSGKRGWIATEMYWPQNHMVRPKEEALRCADCHGERRRLDWKALGYPGDPARDGAGQEAGRAVPASGGGR